MDRESTNTTVTELAQNSRKSARRRIGRPFPKGTSGNPGGRPKGLVKTIREHTRDGGELAAFVLRVFRGEIEGVKLRDQVEAASWLADRGFGKPAQSFDVTSSHVDPSKWSDEQLEAYSGGASLIEVLSMVKHEG